jgi:predicted DNA-binding transcriptional regulator AlpA
LTWEVQVSSDVLVELREEMRSLNMAELSKVTGLPTWRIRELVGDGNGPPFFRIGSTYRFPVSGVRKWYADLTSSTKEG